MNVVDIFDKASKRISKHSPELLTGVSIFGVVATAYHASKATLKAKEQLDIVRLAGEEDVPITDILDKREIIALTWRHYIPTAITGGLTVSSIVASNRISAKRVGAATAAYALAEHAYSEYREQVREEFGEAKEEKIQNAVTEKLVQSNDPSNIVMVGSGQTTCFEQYTGRYFLCDIATLKDAVNKINHKITHELYVTLDEFYMLLDIPGTSESDTLGWDSDRLLELSYQPVLDPDGKPVLGFTYNYVKPLK